MTALVYNGLGDISRATHSWIIRHELGLHPPFEAHGQSGRRDETSAKVALRGRLR